MCGRPCCREPRRRIAPRACNHCRPDRGCARYAILEFASRDFRCRGRTRDEGPQSAPTPAAKSGQIGPSAPQPPRPGRVRITAPCTISRGSRAWPKRHPNERGGSPTRALHRRLRAGRGACALCSNSGRRMSRSISAWCRGGRDITKPPGKPARQAPGEVNARNILPSRGPITCGLQGSARTNDENRRAASVAGYAPFARGPRSLAFPPPLRPSLRIIRCRLLSHSSSPRRLERKTKITAPIAPAPAKAANLRPDGKGDQRGGAEKHKRGQRRGAPLSRIDESARHRRTLQSSATTSTAPTRRCTQPGPLAPIACAEMPVRFGLRDDRPSPPTPKDTPAACPIQRQRHRLERAVNPRLTSKGRRERQPAWPNPARLP